MASFEVEGGKILEGEIIPQGSKNEAFQVIAATLLTDQEVIIHNIPEIRDILNFIKLLEGLGVKVVKLSSEKSSANASYSFLAKNINIDFLNSDAYRSLMQSVRGSILMLGPLLIRLGECKIFKPGGDAIGRRRLDTHFLAIQKLGVAFEYDPKKLSYIVHGSKLNNANILLDEASVTGTANIIMTAIFVDGITTIYNAACEPYIQQLCKMLNTMGAKISGIGSNFLTIEGVKPLLAGIEHTIFPDMIEIGSCIGVAAMTKSAITIKNVKIKELGIIPNIFRRLGVQVDEKGDDLYIPKQEHYEIEMFIDRTILTFADAVWPGLTPDLLSVILTVATQAKGTVLIHQKMFESRLFFVDKLIDMGAQVILCDPHRAIVTGLDWAYPLRCITMTSPDIRAGMSLLIAAMSGEGVSIIRNIEQIDRGYHKIEERLNALGAKIKRIN